MISDPSNRNVNVTYNPTFFYWFADLSVIQKKKEQDVIRD